MSVGVLRALLTVGQVGTSVQTVVGVVVPPMSRGMGVPAPPIVRPGDTACKLHVPAVPVRRSFTIVSKVNGVALPTFTLVVAIVASLENSIFPPKEEATVVSQAPCAKVRAVHESALAVGLWIANAPAIIATSMKVAASFRMLRFFKILIEKTFLVSTHCPDNTTA